MNEVLSKNNYRKLLVEDDVTVINKKEEVTFNALLWFNTTKAYILSVDDAEITLIF